MRYIIEFDSTPLTDSQWKEMVNLIVEGYWQEKFGLSVFSNVDYCRVCNFLEKLNIYYN